MHILKTQTCRLLYSKDDHPPLVPLSPPTFVFIEFNLSNILLVRKLQLKILLIFTSVALNLRLKETFTFGLKGEW